MSDDPKVLKFIDFPPKTEFWQPLTLEQLRGIKYDPVIFSQEYPGEPFDPFADYCLCGHPPGAHNNGKEGKYTGRCRGTHVDDDCTCMKYLKKGRSDEA